VEAQFIRLVELALGTRDEPVVIPLFIAELEHHPEYDAISYVWGNPEDTLHQTWKTRSSSSPLNLQFLNKGLWPTFGQMYRTPGQLPHILGKID
jgi:hypothetical protein